LVFRAVRLGLLRGKLMVGSDHSFQFSFMAA
jgi:hypothetical protein